MYKHAVLTDFVLFKCNYCVKSVIDAQSPMMRFARVFQSHHMYKHAVLTDFVLFKCNYCVKSVIDAQSPMMRFAR
ncbi:hypothetical protein TSAR_001112, partial [Trichomalopsis sarcophagae]